MSVKVFISYAIENDNHNKDVADFSNKLQLQGIDVIFFNQMQFGERLPRFMEKIAESDFTLFICTPEYARKANEREGGVGTEWNIVTGSVYSENNEHKFIPILFSGNWDISIPVWARGKRGIDYRNRSDAEFQKLLNRFSQYERKKYCVDYASFLDYSVATIVDPKDTFEYKARNRRLALIDGFDERVIEKKYHISFDDGLQWMLYRFVENRNDISLSTLYVSRVTGKDGEKYLLKNDLTREQLERIKKILPKNID